MTIRDLANEAAKRGCLDAHIITHTKKGIHDVGGVDFMPVYRGNIQEGRAILRNVVFIEYADKPMHFVDRGRDDGYLELED